MLFEEKNGPMGYLATRQSFWETWKTRKKKESIKSGSTSRYSMGTMPHKHIRVSGRERISTSIPRSEGSVRRWTIGKKESTITEQRPRRKNVVTRTQPEGGGGGVKVAVILQSALYCEVDPPCKFDTSMIMP